MALWLPELAPENGGWLSPVEGDHVQNRVLLESPAIQVNKRAEEKQKDVVISSSGVQR